MSLEFDKEGKLWFDTMYQGAIGMLDPKTGQAKYYPLPPEWNDNTVQLNFVGLRHDVDGKVWTKSVGTAEFSASISPAANGKIPSDQQPAAGPQLRHLSGDLGFQNNLWLAEFDDGHLGKIDAKTQQVTWYTPPTPHARLRRMEIDGQDRITVTEYRGNKVAVFDPKTESFTEYNLPPETYPYRAEFDKNGDLWASTMRPTASCASIRRPARRRNS